MLNVSKLCASYGSIKALDELTISLPAKSLVALLGSNGAGKSTALRTIAGLHRSTSGTSELMGEDVTRMPAHKVVARGLALVPEGRMVLAPLNIEQNLRLSSYAGRGSYRENLERVYSLFPRLYERRTQQAGSLSGGEQQMLALGRALMTSPHVLLLDEPSMGLAPVVVDAVYEAVMAIHAIGQSILLVEQNAALALPICDYAYILQRGKVVAEGKPADLDNSQELQGAYLG